MAVLVVAGAAAYVARDRWMPLVPGLQQAGGQQAAGDQSDAARPGRQGGGRGGRGGGRGGRFGGADGPIAVVAAEAKTADVPVTVDGVGTVKPLNSVTVRPQVDGQLVQVLFREGQDVKRGDVLARIDDATYRATLDQALAKQQQDQATLANAQRDLDRYVGLARTNAVTNQQVDAQRATVAQTTAILRSDEAAIESARATLGYTQVTAPIDGRTGIRNVDEGNLVHASDTTGIVTLSQIRPISVLFSVPQQDLSRISRAAAKGALPVAALSDDGTGAIDQRPVDLGTLTVVDNQVDSTTGTVRLKAEFPNADLQLWPGAFVNARLTVETLRDVVTIPSAAVQRGPDGAFVYTVQGGGAGETVKQVPVTLGQQDDQQAVVTAGVQAGDRVVTTGFARLQDGAKVQVSAPGAATPEASANPDAKPATDAQAQPAQGGRHNRPGEAVGQGRHGRGGQANRATSDASAEASNGTQPGASATAAGGAGTSVGMAGPGAVNPASP